MNINSLIKSIIKETIYVGEEGVGESIPTHEVEQKYEEGGFETSTRTSRLLVKDYLTVKSSEKHKKLLKKYHYEPIELTEVGKKKYFLLEQVQKREHIMLNVLGKY